MEDALSPCLAQVVSTACAPGAYGCLCLGDQLCEHLLVGAGGAALPACPLSSPCSPLGLLLSIRSSSQSASPQILKRLCYKPGATLDTGVSFPDPKPQLETSEDPSSFNLVGPTWALPSALQPTSTHPASPHTITYFHSLAPLAPGFSSLHATTACPAEHSSPPCRLLWTHL